MILQLLLKWDPSPSRGICPSSHVCPSINPNYLLQCGFPVSVWQSQINLLEHVNVRIGQRVRESVGFEKTLKISKSNHQRSSTTTFITKPCPWVPYAHIFRTLPDMRTPPLSWAIHARTGQPFTGRNFPSIPPKPLLLQLETVCPCPVPHSLGVKPVSIFFHLPVREL